MANVSKGYGVGDTVWVWFHGSNTLMWAPVSKVVADVKVNSSSNEAVVTFTDGTSVTDGATARVFTTQAACAKAIVDDGITKLTPAVVLDTTTTSGASTAGAVATTLIRKN